MIKYNSQKIKIITTSKLRSRILTKFLLMSKPIYKIQLKTRMEYLFNYLKNLYFSLRSLIFLPLKYLSTLYPKI